MFLSTHHRISLPSANTSNGAPVSHYKSMLVDSGLSALSLGDFPESILKPPKSLLSDCELPGEQVAVPHVCRATSLFLLKPTCNIPDFRVDVDVVSTSVPILKDAGDFLRTKLFSCLLHHGLFFSADWFCSGAAKKNRCHRLTTGITAVRYHTNEGGVLRSAPDYFSSLVPLCRTLSCREPS